jgi:hypothetical protein
VATPVVGRFLMFLQKSGTIKAKSMLADVPDNMDDEAVTPAATHLFDVDENQSKMDKKKTLFVCNQAR